MRIIISDDYQNSIHSLECFKKLRKQNVIIHNDTVTELNDLAARFAGAEALLLIRERTAIKEDLLEKLPDLKFISQTGKAINHIDLEACTRRGIVVSADGGATNAAAELTWALVLASARRVALEAEKLRQGYWQTSLGVTLKGRTLGILGYGRIGSIVASYGRAFGMEVVTWSKRQESIERAQAEGIRIIPDKGTFFSSVDVLSVHLRLSQATQGCITLQDLMRMKPTSHFINTARAELIESGALVKALKQGRPGFAGVDVFETEPIYGANHPLLRMENVVCTPHLGYVEKDTYEHYFGIAIEQLLAFEQGKPINVLNPEVLQ